jgi:hypothetical protein
MDIIGTYGGSYGAANNKRFFYLVVNGNAGEEKETLNNQQAFFRSGINSGPDYVFIFIDIGSDARLARDLCKRTGGDALYKQIEEKCPLFLITYRPIEHIGDVAAISVRPIKFYEDEVSVLYDEMGIKDLGARKRFVKFLRRVNRYANLKPNIFGIGANVNEIITDLIDKLDLDQP